MCFKAALPCILSLSQTQMAMVIGKKKRGIVLVLNVDDTKAHKTGNSVLANIDIYGYNKRFRHQSLDHKWKEHISSTCT